MEFSTTERPYPLDRLLSVQILIRNIILKRLMCANLSRISCCQRFQPRPLRQPRARFLPQAARQHSPNLHLRRWTSPANLPTAHPNLLLVLRGEFERLLGLATPVDEFPTRTPRLLPVDLCRHLFVSLLVCRQFLRNSSLDSQLLLSRFPSDSFSCR